jgi:hypothetical protein
MVSHVPCGLDMKNYVLFCLAIIGSTSTATAQLVSIGVLGGIPFLQPNDGGDESRRYIVGPSIEFRLPGGFAIEVDGLYRRIGNSYSSGVSGSVISPGTSFVSIAPYPSFFIDRQRGNYWEFPVIAKYYFRPRSASWQPFIGTGWALRTIGFHENSSETLVDANGNSHFQTFQSNTRSDLGVGAVAAAGVRFRVGRLAFTPEIRYIYWGSTEQFDLRRNEAAVLLGISF